MSAWSDNYHFMQTCRPCVYWLARLGKFPSFGSRRVAMVESFSLSYSQPLLDRRFDPHVSQLGHQNRSHVGYTGDDNRLSIHATVNEYLGAESSGHCTLIDRVVLKSVCRRIFPGSWAGGDGWWWWYHNLTTHQHQKGHTVPKQVIMLATSIQVATV